MTIQFYLTWWVIPTIITIVSLLWAFFWPIDNTGMHSGLTRLFMLIPALVVIALSWLAVSFIK